MGHHILAKRDEPQSGETQYSITLRLARFAARGFAAREVVQVHVHLSADFHRLCRVPPEATADGIGNNPKPLTELIDEAQGELAVADGRSDKESSGDLGK